MLPIKFCRKTTTIESGLKELIRLANLLEVQVQFCKGESFTEFQDNEPTIISITSNLKPRTKLWTLAHELGHVISYMNCSKSIKKRLLNRPNSFWELEAEVRAWNCADFLLEQLNPALYEEKYIKFKHSKLKTYYRIQET